MIFALFTLITVKYHVSDGKKIVVPVKSSTSQHNRNVSAFLSGKLLRVAKTPKIVKFAYKQCVRGLSSLTFLAVTYGHR